MITYENQSSGSVSYVHCDVGRTQHPGDLANHVASNSRTAAGEGRLSHHQLEGITRDQADETYVLTVTTHKLILAYELPQVVISRSLSFLPNKTEGFEPYREFWQQLGQIREMRQRPTELPSKDTGKPK
jgi:hypothetical protein